MSDDMLILSLQGWQPLKRYTEGTMYVLYKSYPISEGIYICNEVTDNVIRGVMRRKPTTDIRWKYEHATWNEIPEECMSAFIQLARD